MKHKLFCRYYLCSCVGVLLTSYYPLSMGVRVIANILAYGTVWPENHPKYIIPDTPICLAILIGVLIVPRCMKMFQRYASVGGSIAAIGMFFALEILFEQKVVVTAAKTVAKLEDWQMCVCYISPQEGENIAIYKAKTAIDILMGDYSPAFKLHFYIISLVLILSILHCFYEFG